MQYSVTYNGVLHNKFYSQFTDLQYYESSPINIAQHSRNIPKPFVLYESKPTRIPIHKVSSIENLLE